MLHVISNHLLFYGGTFMQICWRIIFSWIFLLYHTAALTLVHCRTMYTPLYFLCSYNEVIREKLILEGWTKKLYLLKLPKLTKTSICYISGSKRNHATGHYCIIFRALLTISGKHAESHAIKVELQINTVTFNYHSTFLCSPEKHRVIWYGRLLRRRSCLPWYLYSKLKESVSCIEAKSINPCFSLELWQL